MSTFAKMVQMTTGGAKRRSSRSARTTKGFVCTGNREQIFSMIITAMIRLTILTMMQCNVYLHGMRRKTENGTVTCAPLGSGVLLLIDVWKKNCDFARTGAERGHGGVLVLRNVSGFERLNIGRKRAALTKSGTTIMNRRKYLGEGIRRCVSGKHIGLPDDA